MPMSEERLGEIDALFWYKRADRSDMAAKELIAAYRHLRAELAATKAENERLTAWLTHIKNTGDEFGFIAEEALDGTPFDPEPTP